MSLHQGHLLRCSITIVIQLSLAMTITKMACSDDRTPDAEFHRRWMASDQTPFSFVYGGRPSSELLRKWNRTVEEKAVDATQMQRVVTWSDPETKLEIRAVLTNYLDTPSVVWTLYITNRGEKDTPILEHLRAVDVTTSVTGDVTLHRSIGSPCRADDWLPLSEAIPVGKRTELAPSDGRSASGESPFFDLQWTGGGVITAVGWSGQWNATIERTSENSLRLRAGMQNMRLALHPGETIRSPKIMQLYWFGDDVWNGYNQFRRVMLAHVVPRIGGNVVTPPIVHLSTSYYELNKSNEQNVLSHLDSIKGLGFEMFWLDAYWTGPNGFPESMGNYGFPIERVEPRDRFPNGLKAIGDAVEKEGLGFVLWFEPERVVPGTLLAKEHPEWVMLCPGDGNGLYNLGIPEARQYMTDYLNAAIKAYKVSCLRIDYNIAPLPFWQSMDAKDPNRLGMTEIRYIEGLYRMWDDILKANPKLFIDNCASGGRRIDLETMSRSIPLWRSDNTCDMLDMNPATHPATVVLAAMKNQVMNAGLNRYVPFSTVGQMGATPYLFRSGVNAGIAFGEDVRPAAYPRELLKQAVAEAKRLRPYFFGDFYVLGDVTLRPEDWCVYQYHRQQEQDGMVMAFRRPASPQATFVAPLHRIDAMAEYDITLSYGYQASTAKRIKGAELASLNVRIEECPGAVVIEYKKVKPIAVISDGWQHPTAPVEHKLASARSLRWSRRP